MSVVLNLFVKYFSKRLFEYAEKSNAAEYRYTCVYKGRGLTQNRGRERRLEARTRKQVGDQLPRGLAYKVYKHAAGRADHRRGGFVGKLIFKQSEDNAENADYKEYRAKHRAFACVRAILCKGVN